MTNREKSFWKWVDTFGIRVFKKRNKYIKRMHLEAYKVKKDYKKQLTATLLFCCVPRNVGKFLENQP